MKRIFRDEYQIYLVEIPYRAIISLITLSQGDLTTAVVGQIDRLNKWIL
jgi:hypothetical protein